MSDSPELELQESLGCLTWVVASKLLFRAQMLSRLSSPKAFLKRVLIPLRLLGAALVSSLAAIIKYLTEAT